MNATLTRRLFKYVRIGALDRCWLWEAAVDKDGYGRLQHRDKTLKAHRVMFELARGPIPKGRLVCHTCDVPGCVNPRHLYAGTPKNNVEDCIARGRYRPGGKPHYGTANHKAKLTPQIVKELRTKRQAGEKIKDLCAAYGICKSTAERVVSGRYWGHVT